MKKILKIQFCVTVILYTLVYLIASFIQWEFYNPFFWLIDLPIYDNETRGMIIFSIFIYYLISILTIYGITQDYKRTKEK